ncbi:PilZ domain-containing protein [Saliniramus sp.]|uniref:PilZ domain-containing protein n=1 Tax=Saliniramus sp. TaxID=2986772 RepID=UPI002C97D907|nr:PilZ domain-containing protein [Saliniramus sp.]HMB11316.1 PilZ domain-containing protein [Saliniramus sp.]
MIAAEPHATAEPAIVPGAERRRFARVDVALDGRYMLADRKDHPCRSVSISPGNLTLEAPVIGAIGERVVCHLPLLGRLEGEIVRHMPHGFAMSMITSRRQRLHLADQLTWLANRDALGLGDERAGERLVPSKRSVFITLSDGRRLKGRVLDLSRTGAGLTVSQGLAPGTMLTIGNTPARVVRATEEAIGVHFHDAIPADVFNEDIRL